MRRTSGCGEAAPGEEAAGEVAREGEPPGPSRRSALCLGAAAGAALLAGCTADVGEELPPNREWPVADLTPDLPVRERTDLLAEGIESMADEEIEDLDSFEAAFDDRALEVESIGEENDVLTFEYVNPTIYEEGKLHDIGPIAGAYAALIESGFETPALSISILDAAPSSYGSAWIETGWAEAYAAGDRSAAEYGELVTTTIESQRHPPEVGVTPDE